MTKQTEKPEWEHIIGRTDTCGHLLQQVLGDSRQLGRFAVEEVRQGAASHADAVSRQRLLQPVQREEINALGSLQVGDEAWAIACATEPPVPSSFKARAAAGQAYGLEGVVHPSTRAAHSPLASAAARPSLLEPALRSTHGATAFATVANIGSWLSLKGSSQ